MTGTTYIERAAVLCSQSKVFPRNPWKPLTQNGLQEKLCIRRYRGIPQAPRAAASPVRSLEGEAGAQTHLLSTSICGLCVLLLGWLFAHSPFHTASKCLPHSWSQDCYPLTTICISKLKFSSLIPWCLANGLPLLGQVLPCPSIISWGLVMHGIWGCSFLGLWWCRLRRIPS